MALTLRETKGNSEIIGPGPKEIGLSPLPIPTRAIHGPNEEGERAKEEEEVGFIMARQETNLSQLQCWPAVLQGRQAAGRKEEANAVRLLFQCDTKQASGGWPSCPWGPGASSSKLETVTFPPSFSVGWLIIA